MKAQGISSPAGCLGENRKIGKARKRKIEEGGKSGKARELKSGKTEKTENRETGKAGKQSGRGNDSVSFVDAPENAVSQ